MNTFTSKDVLLHAIKVLENTGWCQGGAYDQRGRHCLVGAINKAVVDLATGQDVLPMRVTGELLGLKSVVSTRQTAIEVVSDVISEEVNDPSIPNFNDRFDRTKEEVIEVMRKAADRLP